MFYLLSCINRINQDYYHQYCPASSSRLSITTTWSYEKLWRIFLALNIPFEMRMYAKWSPTIIWLFLTNYGLTLLDKLWYTRRSYLFWGGNFCVSVFKDIFCSRNHSRAITHNVCRRILISKYNVLDTLFDVIMNV